MSKTKIWLKIGQEARGRMFVVRILQSLNKKTKQCPQNHFACCNKTAFEKVGGYMIYFKPLFESIPLIC